MPSHKQITITLVSHSNTSHSDVALPEYSPPLDVNEVLSPDTSIGNDGDVSEVTVYVPTQPSSRFWIAYSIAKPYQLNEAWYFKLFVDRVPVVSWICDATNGYKGRIKYGLFDAENGQVGANGIEKRVLKFEETVLNPTKAEESQPEKAVEVKAFRIWNRMAAQVEVPSVGEKLGGGMAGRICLARAGPLERGHPLNRYKVRLIDPLDSPYVNFRFLYRSHKELNDLGITPSEEATPIRHDIPILSSEEVSSVASMRQQFPSSLANFNRSIDPQWRQAASPYHTASTVPQSVHPHPATPPASQPFALRVNSPTPSPPNSPLSDDSPIRIPRFAVAQSSVSSPPNSPLSDDSPIRIPRFAVAQSSASSQVRSAISAHQDNNAINNPRINFQQRVAALLSNENNRRAPTPGPPPSPTPERQLRPKDSLGMLRSIANRAKNRNERKEDGKQAVQR